MTLFSKLKDELNRAGNAAKEAIDDGKLRLDLMRTRQAMDKAATKVGYAVYRARKAGGDVPADEYARLSAEVANAEAEIERIETLMREAAARRKGGQGEATEPPPAS